MHRTPNRAARTAVADRIAREAEVAAVVVEAVGAVAVDVDRATRVDGTADVKE